MATFTSDSISETSSGKRRSDSEEDVSAYQPQKKTKIKKHSTSHPVPEQASNDDAEDQTQASNGRTGGLAIGANTANALQPLLTNQPANVAAGEVVDEIHDRMQSAGLLFTSLLNADDQLVDTVRKPYAREQTMPRGFSQERVFMCYRNSVIVALLNCQRFMSYVTNWHMNFEDPDEPQPPAKKKYPFRILHEIHCLGKLYWMGSPENGETNRKFYDERMESFFRGCNHRRDRLPNLELQGRIWQSWAERVQNAADPDDQELAIFQQQDVSEFLVWMLDAIDRQLSRDPRYPWRSQEYLYALKQPQENFNYLFKLRLTERGACPQCRYPVWHRWAHTSPVIEHALQLHVPEKHGSSNNGRPSLIDSIREYMNVERSYKCSRCGRQSESIPVRLRLQALPEVLFISINRTAYDPKLGAIKNVNVVHIPENLDLSEWLEQHEFGDGSKATYRLSSIISHSSYDEGGLNTGHYISIVRGHGTTSNWLAVDDDKVTHAELCHWDDSFPIKPETDRWTPVLMMYEKVEEVRRPGKKPMHIGWVSDAHPPDDRLDHVRIPRERVATPNANSEKKQSLNQGIRSPKQSFRELNDAVGASPEPTDRSNISEDSLFGDPAAGGVTELFPSIEQDKETKFLWPGAGTLSSHFCAPSTDIEFKKAELFVNVRIGEYDFDFPRRTLEYFNPFTERELKVKAVLKSADPQTKEDMYLDLMGGKNGGKKAWQRQSCNERQVGDKISEAAFSKRIKPQILKAKPAKVQTDVKSKSDCKQGVK